MKQFPPLFAVRVFILLALGALLASPAARASEAAAPLHGFWVADTEATLMELAKTRKEALRDYEMEDLKTMLASLFMEIDLPGMRFMEQSAKNGRQSFTIEKIEEDKGTIRFLGEHRRYSCTMREDGKILMGSGVVMRRATEDEVTAHGGR